MDLYVSVPEFHKPRCDCAETTTKGNGRDDRTQSFKSSYLTATPVPGQLLWPRTCQYKSASSGKSPEVDAQYILQNLAWHLGCHEI